MYTTYNNRQLERQLDREEKEEVQIDVYNLKQKIDREIVRQRRGGGRHRFMFTAYNNRLIERQLVKEEEEVGTDRCLQQKNNRLIERYLEREEKEEVGTDRCIQLKTKDRQRDSQIVKRRRQAQVYVYNIQQQIVREIVSWK